MITKKRIANIAVVSSVLLSSSLFYIMHEYKTKSIDIMNKAPSEIGEYINFKPNISSKIQECLTKENINPYEEGLENLVIHLRTNECIKDLKDDLKLYENLQNKYFEWEKNEIGKKYLENKRKSEQFGISFIFSSFYISIALGGRMTLKNERNN